MLFYKFSFLLFFITSALFLPNKTFSDEKVPSKAIISTNRVHVDTESTSQIVYTPKLFYLFQIILNNKIEINTSENVSKRRKKEENLRLQALEEILKEFEVTGWNKKTLIRFLNNLYQNNPEEVRTKIANAITETFSKNTSSYSFEKEKVLVNFLNDLIYEFKEKHSVPDITTDERKALEIFHKLSFINQPFEEFLESQERFLELLEKQEQNLLSEIEKKELHEFEKSERIDLRTLEKTLSSLGLPPEAQNIESLKMILKSLRIDLHNIISQNTNQDLNPKATSEIRDKTTVQALRNMKLQLDYVHNLNLKEMRSVKNFIKSFPAQFILFHVAVGASIYQQTLSDPYYYGAEKNPESFMQTMEQSLSPSGLVSFALFVYVSQQIHSRLYTLGTYIDGKSLKTPFGQMSFNGKFARAFSPSAGLAAGFFISSVFMEFYQDPNTEKCVKTLLRSPQKNTVEQEEVNSEYNSSCDMLSMTWINSNKMNTYMVDIVTLLGASSLSRKLILSTLSMIRLSSLGSNLLNFARKSPKFLNPFSFVVNIFFFLETHSLLDTYIGQPIKNQISVGSIKNGILDFNPYFEENLSEIKSSLFLEDGTQSLINTDQSIKHIKNISHTFQEWINLKSRSYQESGYWWSKQLNKLLLPYEASSSLIKSFFMISRFDYGLNTNLQNEESEETEETFYWDTLNTPLILDRSILSNFKYCSDVTPSEPLLSSFCPEKSPDIPSEEDNSILIQEIEALIYPDIPSEKDSILIQEIAALIYRRLNSIQDDLDNSIQDDLDFTPYLSTNYTEIFSSDPKYSIKYLNTKTQVLLAKSLLTASLYGSYPKSICSRWFPNMEQIELYQNCLNMKSPQFNYQTKQQLKLLIAGIYVVKNIFNFDNTSTLIQYFQPRRIYGPYRIALLNSLKKSDTIALLNSLKVYKKGEKLFLDKIESFKSYKKKLSSQEFKNFEENFYFSEIFMRDFICGTETSEKEDNQFIPPQIFIETDITVYDFSTKQFKNLEYICKPFTKNYKLSERQRYAFHDLLFNHPAQRQRDGKKYENLYLALEDIIHTDSSKKKLMEHFEELSKKQLKSIGTHIQTNLEQLINNYYKEMINLDSNPLDENSDFKEYQSYYNTQKLYNISSFDDASTKHSLRGLEASIFQVNYWLNNLKQSLQIGNETYEINGEQSRLNDIFHKIDPDPKDRVFNVDNFEKFQFEILALLQSYHNSYKQDKGPYTSFPDKQLLNEMNSIFNSEGKKAIKDKYGSNRFTCLLDLHKCLNLPKKDTDPPVLIPPEIILSHILDSSLPRWNQSGVLSFLLNNKNIAERVKQNTNDTKKTAEEINQQEWKFLIYSIVFELNASLNNFYSQIQPLQMKDSLNGITN